MRKNGLKTRAPLCGDRLQALALLESLARRPGLRLRLLGAPDQRPAPGGVRRGRLLRVLDSAGSAAERLLVGERGVGVPLTGRVGAGY